MIRTLLFSYALLALMTWLLTSLLPSPWLHVPMIVLVVLAIAFFNIYRLRQRSRKLAAAIEEMERERFPVSWRPSPWDGLGEVSSALHNLSSHLEKRFSELQRESRQLAAILSSLVESVVAIDHEGRLLFLNAAAETFFSVSAREVKGRPFLEVLRHSALNRVIQQTQAGQKSVEEEIVLLSPAERIVTVHARPVSYEEGQRGVLVALHDITELRKLERVRQEFVANVSHELKTPLTAIKGFVDTLLEGALEDPIHNREFLKTIQNHTRHLAMLVDDVLDLAAIEGKRLTYRFEAVSLSEVTGRILKALAPMAKTKKVSIENRLAEDLPSVRADRDRLAQILINLVDNAIKFNKPEGRVCLYARPGQNRVSVMVQDTGIGIPKEDLPRVFERFYRVDKSRTHDIPGTGLGLAIVKHLVEAHQGTIQVQSQLNEGSVFQFDLPLA